MPVKIDSTGTTVVDPAYHWLAMDSCPLHLKVRVISDAGVSMDTIIKSGAERSHWKGWVPSPTFAKEPGDIYAKRT